jgi:hypothetical protein
VPGSSAIGLAAAASTGSGSSLLYSLPSSHDSQLPITQPTKHSIRSSKSQLQWTQPAVLPRVSRPLDAAVVDKLIEFEWESAEIESISMADESEWVDEIAADALLAEAF